MEKIKHIYAQYWSFVKEPMVIAFTAMVCLWLAQGLRLPQGYWAVMSSIIVMQPNVQETISASLSRLAGTAIGAIAGGLFLDLYGVHIWVFGVAVMIVVLICIFLNLKQSNRLAGVTVAIILLVNHSESPWMTALHRFLEVSLGVVVALLISFLLSRIEKITTRAFFVVLTISLLIMRPALSYADWHGHDGNEHHHDGDRHDHHGHSYIGLDFSVWPDNYYYSAPYYPPPDQVLVSSSVYEPVAVNGTTYYLNNGTYYIYNGYSYQAVAAPVTVVPQPTEVIEPSAVVYNQTQSMPPVITTPVTASDIVNSITINIPNNKGGYTAVTLKKSGNGFLGPQGEFYPEFPKVSQLEVIYGK